MLSSVFDSVFSQRFIVVTAGAGMKFCSACTLTWAWCDGLCQVAEASGSPQFGSDLRLMQREISAQWLHCWWRIVGSVVIMQQLKEDLFSKVRKTKNGFKETKQLRLFHLSQALWNYRISYLFCKSGVEVGLCFLISFVTLVQCISVGRLELYCNWKSLAKENVV